MKIYLINETTNKLQSTINVNNLDNNVFVDGNGFIVVTEAPPSDKYMYYYIGTGWCIDEII